MAGSRTPAAYHSLSGSRRGPRALRERLFAALGLVATLLPILLVAFLLGQVVADAIARLSWDFLTSFPSLDPAQAGIYPAIVGTLYLMGLTAVMALPAGFGAALYLEEYQHNARLARLLEVNIAQLGGVPSVIYGLLGWGVFVRTLGWGSSVLTGAATLSLLVQPMVITAGREALRAVPRSHREACLALGATHWQAIREVVLPAAVPGMLTGSVLSLSRALGETTPLLVIGAMTYVSSLPEPLRGPFTALPVQIFHWASRPRPPFLLNAAASIVVLLAAMLLLHVVALLLRDRVQRR